ncbi:hypothetical protein Poli38472_000417 [Pythium oligandrum]|uniref:Mitochondrial import receptor subunit TOM70 n=1 Tax=Pythium oligandrum TaxID=41045 RepID=A0A8K1FEC0_PYTOL|nr:hypothetical protein Poli38472_000417 [Pythium oligandrum]|eukprot:TMW60375.1 hypothetical protein Poli38472_000417 [Pythium oligandrum]
MATSQEQRAVVQLAVLASITMIGSFVLFGVYRKRKEQGVAVKKQQQGELAFEDTTGKTQDAATKTKGESGAGLKKKKVEFQDPATPTEAAASPTVALGQEAATEATKKYKAGDYVEAIELYSQAIQQTETTVPVDKRNLKVMFSNRAAAYERINDHEQVINDCTSALLLDNRHPKAYLRRAKAKTAMGDLAGALVDYVCLLVISEEKNEQMDESMALEISRIHTEITTQEIEKVKAKELNPNRYLPDQFFITSYYSSFHKNDDESDLVADESVEFYSEKLYALGENDETRRERGELLTKRALARKEVKQYEEAAADCEAALALVQPGEDAYYTANVEGGTYYHLRGEFENAQTCFEAALKVKPHSLFAKIRMGGLCFDRKELKQALRWFDKALADKPTCATAYFHRGQLHSIDTEGSTMEDSMALALKDLERCLELASDFSMAYIQLGVTQARSGNFDKAIEYLKTAARITPDVPEIYNYLGETYMQMAQMPGAGVEFSTIEEMFEKAIELDSSYPMAYINKGNLLVQKGSEYGHEALSLFEKAVTECPRSKFAYCHLAQVYMAMQDYSRAIEQIDRAISYAFAAEELNELFAIRITAETHQQAKLLLN